MLRRPTSAAVRLFGRAEAVAVRMFRERYGANGRDVVVIASEYATNAIFQCLSNDITDIVAANQFMIRLQLERKEYGRMASHLQPADPDLPELPRRNPPAPQPCPLRDPRDQWGGRPERDVVQRVRRQANEVIEQDRIDPQRPADRGNAVRDEGGPPALLREIDGLGSTAFSRHAAINGDVTRLHEEFLENKSIRAMRQPEHVDALRDHEDDILRPLLRL